jgi:Spy/CpxP family protein refolding chaperone
MGPDGHGGRDDDASLIRFTGKFMKLVPTRFVPGLAAAAIAVTACLAVATVVDAQTPPPKGAPDGRPPMKGPGEHGPGMHHMRELYRFKASLALNAQQAALWDRAATAMKPPANMREQMRARHDKLEAMLDDPNFDPRKLASEMDAAGAQRKAHMTSIRDAWIAVYESLHPMQRGQVREFLRERMAGRHHGGMMRGRGEWMHHEGDRPMPPMPPRAPMAPGAPQTPPTR